MIGRCPNPMGLRVAAFAGVLVLGAAPSPAQQPGSNPFDGEWTLEFRVNTKPGGESFTTTQGMAVSPHSLSFHAASPSFRFREDRSVVLEIREPASLAISSTARFGGITIWDRQQHRGQARVQGNGTGDAEDRTVKLAIRWGSLEGTGFATDSVGTSSSHRSRTSEDMTSVTLSNETGSGTFPFEWWKSAWELRPASIEQTEVSPEVIVETVTYRGRMASRLTPLDPGGFGPPLPVVEEIELKQVRYLKLVPRG